MKSLISLSLVILLGFCFAQEVRITNNHNHDYTSPNNAFSIALTPPIPANIHIVYYSDETYTGDTEVVYARSTDWGQSFQKTIISNEFDGNKAWTPSIASSHYGNQPHLNIAFYDDDFNPDIDEDDEAIWSRRSTNNGEEWLDRFQVRPEETEEIYDYDPSNAIGDYWNPDPASYLTHYVWIEDNEDNDRIGVMYGRRLVPLSGGGPGGDWLRYTTLIQWPDADPELPSIATLGNYVYVVAQADDENGNTHIYFRRNTYYGENDYWQPAQILDQSASIFEYSENPCIAACDKYVYVVWEQYIHIGTFFAPTIYFRRSSDCGASWEDSYQLLSGLSGSQPMNIYPNYDYTPSITCGGEVVAVVWQNRIGSYAAHLNLALSEAFGERGHWSLSDIGGYWPPTRLDPEMNPSIIFSGIDFHIVWTDAYDGGIDNPEIYYRHLTFDELKGRAGGEQSKPTNISSFGFLKVEPNPCDMFTKISFQSATANSILKIYDVTGKLINTLWNGGCKGVVIWDREDANGRRVKAGTYFLTLENGNIKKIAKIIVR